MGTAMKKDPKFGKKIRRFEDLIKLRHERGSVILYDPHPFKYGRPEQPQPAAFVLNMSAWLVHGWIKSGRLHVYQKPINGSRYGRTAKAAK